MKEEILQKALEWAQNTVDFLIEKWASIMFFLDSILLILVALTPQTHHPLGIRVMFVLFGFLLCLFSVKLWKTNTD